MLIGGEWIFDNAGWTGLPLQLTGFVGIYTVPTITIPIDLLFTVRIHMNSLTLTALKHFRIDYGDQKVLQFKIIINVLVKLFFSFEYLCYGYTAIINIFTLTVRGSTFDVRIWYVYVDPRAVKVNPLGARLAK